MFFVPGGFRWRCDGVVILGIDGGFVWAAWKFGLVAFLDFWNFLLLV